MYTSPKLFKIHVKNRYLPLCNTVTFYANVIKLNQAIKIFDRQCQQKRPDHETSAYLY